MTDEQQNRSLKTLTVNEYLRYFALNCSVYLSSFPSGL